MNFKIVGFLLLILAINTQKCLNHAGNEVNWFVILRSPGTATPSYHYFDSNSKDFSYHAGSPDQVNHPVYNTFTSLSNSASY